MVFNITIKITVILIVTRRVESTSTQIIWIIYGIWRVGHNLKADYSEYGPTRILYKNNSPLILVRSDYHGPETFSTTMKPTLAFYRQKKNENSWLAPLTIMPLRTTKKNLYWSAWRSCDPSLPALSPNWNTALFFQLSAWVQVLQWQCHKHLHKWK